MRLERPSRTYEQSWRDALLEFANERVTGFWNYPFPPVDIDEYIGRDSDNLVGKNLPDGWVPATTFWLIDHDSFIGHVQIRHTLNERLEEHGGHIGYAIRPAERLKGYGSKILELALPEAKKIGIRMALIMCDDSNAGSARIIEKNGGVLKDKAVFEGRTIRKYLIEIR